MAYDMTNNEIIEAASRLTPQWLAGFFDGEGCVTVRRHTRCNTFMVSISQADPKILALIALKFGVGVDQGSSTNHRAYVVALSGRTALPFLRYIKDHVICKRRQVEAAIEFATTINGRLTTDEQYATRDRLAEVIKQANHGIDTLIPLSTEGG